MNRASGSPSLFVSRKIVTMFCEGWDTKRSPFEENSIIRALGRLSAYSSTVKPAGAFGSAPSGLSTTRPKLGRGSLGAGNSGRFCWANSPTDTQAVPRQSSFKIRLLFIGLSTLISCRDIVASYTVTLNHHLSFQLKDLQNP